MCTGYTSPFSGSLEIFELLLGDTQRVQLFICSKLFMCGFEILNPKGPLSSMSPFQASLLEEQKGLS